ncbi:MAG TPA: hypothetical protein VIV60_18560 [Polyangiaceae bacterium]
MCVAITSAAIADSHGAAYASCASMRPRGTLRVLIGIFDVARPPTQNLTRDN